MSIQPAPDSNAGVSTHGPTIGGYNWGASIRVLTVPASVDGEVIAALSRALNGASRDAACTALILDLDAALTVMSTAATSALCRVLRSARHSGPRLAIVCSQAPLSDTLRSVFDHVEVHPFLGAALASAETSRPTPAAS